MDAFKHPALQTISATLLFISSGDETDEIGQTLLKLGDKATEAAIEMLQELTNTVVDKSAAIVQRNAVSSKRQNIRELAEEVLALLVRIDSTDNETEQTVLLFGLAQLLHIQGVKFNGNSEII